MPSRMAFQERRPSSRKLRLSRYDQYVKSYAGELERAYRGWAFDAADDVARALARGVGPDLGQSLTRAKAKIGDLIGDLTKLGRQRINGAAEIGLAGALARWSDAPRVAGAVIGLQVQNRQFLQDRLAPQLGQHLDKAVAAAFQAEPEGPSRRTLADAFGAFATSVTPYAGAVVATIFELQRVASGMEDSERHVTGQPPVRVRWLLDPTAEHCADDPRRNTFGCPGLAGEYQAWSLLPTVPAGHVSCLGNCRCRLELDLGQGWESP